MAVSKLGVFHRQAQSDRTWVVLVRTRNLLLSASTLAVVERLLVGMIVVAYTGTRPLQLSLLFADMRLRRPFCSVHIVTGGQKILCAKGQLITSNWPLKLVYARSTTRLTSLHIVQLARTSPEGTHRLRRYRVDLYFQRSNVSLLKFGSGPPVSTFI